MPLSALLLRLAPATSENPGESVQVVPTREVRRNHPIFPAPTLPTPRQWFSEIPFSANLRGKVAFTRPPTAE